MLEKRAVDRYSKHTVFLSSGPAHKPDNPDERPHRKVRARATHWDDRALSGQEHLAASQTGRASLIHLKYSPSLHQTVRDLENLLSNIQRFCWVLLAAAQNAAVLIAMPLIAGSTYAGCAVFPWALALHSRYGTKLMYPKDFGGAWDIGLNISGVSLR